MKLHFPLSLGRFVGLLLVAAPGVALAQSGSLGVGTNTPHPSAALEVASTAKGLLLPRLTQAQRTAIGAPAPGLIVYQTDGSAGFYYYSGTQWLPLQSSGADNLGNHTATQNLNLGSNLLVGNGGTSGLSISNNGNVGIGTSSPTQTLDVAGGVRVSGLGGGTGTRLVMASPNGTLSTSESPTAGTLTGPQPRSTLMSTTAMTGVPVAVTMSGSRIYTLTTTAFQIIDTSDPANPVVISNTPLPPGLLARALDVRGSLLAIVGKIGGGFGSDRFLLYDVADPVAPALRSFAMADGSESVTLISGVKAYVVTRLVDYIQEFDISNMSNAVSYGGFSYGGVTPMRIAVNGTIACIINGGSNSLQIFDVNSFVGLLGTIGTNNSPSDVVLSGTTAYVVNYGSSTLQIFDLSNPSLPVLRGTVSTIASPTAVAVMGNNLIGVTSSVSQTLQTFDVSNPALPVLQGTISTNGATVDVAASGTIAYVLTQQPSLQAFQVQSAPGMLIGQNPNGGVVGILPADLADNLGNHTATRNLNLGANLLVGNGGTTGLAVTANGQVQVTANGWIATNVGSAAGDRVVSGLFNGAATVGGHNNALTAWAPLALNPDGGNVGIGTSTPTAKLHIVGNTLVTGNLTTTGATSVASATVSGTLTANSATVTGLVSATAATVSGTLTTGSTVTSTMSATSATVSGALTASAVTVGGATTLNGGANVSGLGGLRASSTNSGNGITDWIACNVGGTTGDRVVSGLLNGVATVGAHNNALTAWAPLALNPGGNVGIGTSTPGEKLHVAGNTYVSGDITAGGRLTIGGTVSFCGGAYTCSDRRYKKDITPLRSALENVLKLNGYTYFWKQAEFPEKQFTADRQVGFIAQEIEVLYPEMVMTDPKTGYKSVDYARMTPVLLEALKELKQQLDQERGARERATAAAEATRQDFEARLRALEGQRPTAGPAEASLPRK